MSPYPDARLRLKKGFILLSDAVLLLAEQDLGRDWLPQELKEFLPCSRKVSTNADKQVKVFIRRWIDSKNKKLKLKSDIIPVPNELIQRLDYVCEVLRGKLEKFLMMIENGEIKGMLEPFGKKRRIFGINSAPILRVKLWSTYCTGYLMMAHKSGNNKPAHLSFDRAVVRKLQYTTKKSNWGNAQSRSLSPDERRSLSLAVEKFLQTIQCSEYENFSLVFSKGDLARAIAKLAGLFSPTSPGSGNEISRRQLSLQTIETEITKLTMATLKSFAIIES